MTDEEIEEQAIDICNDLDTTVYTSEGGLIDIYGNMEIACRAGIQAGAKQGMEHAIEWHDIESHVLPKREISKKYMPKANEKVMLKYHFYNETEIHYSDGYYDKFDFEFHIPNNPTGRIICVIAWCELLEFKEKK